MERLAWDMISCHFMPPETRNCYTSSGHIRGISRPFAHVSSSLWLLRSFCVVRSINPTPSLPPGLNVKMPGKFMCNSKSAGLMGRRVCSCGYRIACAFSAGLEKDRLLTLPIGLNELALNLTAGCSGHGHRDSEGQSQSRPIINGLFRVCFFSVSFFFCRFPRRR